MNLSDFADQWAAQNTSSRGGYHADMASIFKTVNWQVDALVNGIADGSIQLPELQRPFVWANAKVRDLFDSMYRGYPVGELMFWDTETTEARTISADSPLRGRHQIVDGQQRLTSLYATIKGQPVRDNAYRSRNIAISFNPFTERFEVWTPVFRDSPQWIADISKVFDSTIREKRTFQRTWEKAEGREMTDAEEERLEEVFARLSEMKNYQFNVVHLDGKADKGLVADVFVRINSEGMRLNSSDYILTWLSVFWPEGREEIEQFARRSRMTPLGATESEGVRVRWTPINPFLKVEPSHLVRAMVAIGQGRARLQDAYTALQARDPGTGKADTERMFAQLAQLQGALPIVTDPLNWGEFIHAVQMAGFRSGRNVTSTLNLIYSYVIFLLGRTRFDVDLARLRSVIARWLFMSQLTGRYTGGSESQLSKELDLLSGIADGDADGFVAALDEVIGSELTADYWRFGVPQLLHTSGPALSPAYQCYLAALNILDADMFMLDMRVAQWMDPSLPVQKGLEGHHLFPRNYLDATLGITDVKRINQAANYAPTDWNTNIQISDEPPARYWPALLAGRRLSPEQLERQMYWHALPEGWEQLSYDDFLHERRSRMAIVIRDAFDRLSSGTATGRIRDFFAQETQTATVGLAELIDAGLLRPGDLLDPVDPDWVVDAVISADNELVIDGLDAFDDLDQAARHLEVDHLSGLEFWALERGDELVPLTDLATTLQRD